MTPHWSIRLFLFYVDWALFMTITITWALAWTIFIVAALPFNIGRRLDPVLDKQRQWFSERREALASSVRPIS